MELIRRSSNNVAFSVARVTYSMSGLEIWIMFESQFICDTLDVQAYDLIE
jgi:hypothetical protein